MFIVWSKIRMKRKVLIKSGEERMRLGKFVVQQLILIIAEIVSWNVNHQMKPGEK